MKVTVDGLLLALFCFMLTFESCQLQRSSSPFVSTHSEWLPMTSSYHTAPISVYIFCNLCSLKEPSVNISCLKLHRRSVGIRCCRSAVFRSDHPSFDSLSLFFFLFFSTPHWLYLVREEDGAGETERMDENMEYTPAWSSSHSLSICFHFGVCFKLCAREYAAPKCGAGCF